MQERGLRPLSHVTPHTMRRTYISIALLANKVDVKWVMDQVGHADSTMTLDVYAQLQKRVNRKHGAEFDRLMREARAHLYRNGDSSIRVGRFSSGSCAGASKTPPRRR
jgi:integrase